MAKNRNQAKKMASKGASVKEIRKETGVNRAAAQKFTQNTASRTSTTTTPNDRGPAGNTAPTTNPGISASPSRSTPEIKGLGQGIRLAGENGLSKSDYKTIAETTGKSDDKIVGRLDKINTKLEESGKAGITLKSGTANMLVRNAQKTRNNYRGFGPNTSVFGEGAIGSTLQSMIPGPGTWINGQLREGDPGFNPGGSPNKNRMIGGTVIRPNGTIANKGVGKQYELPNRFKGEEEVVNNDDALDTTNTGGDGDGIINGEGDTQITPEPIEPVEEVDRSASSGAGGLDLASWATSFKKARSARQKSGRPAQGLASQKKNPFKSWA
jgi:hypothetical protein